MLPCEIAKSDSRVFFHIAGEKINRFVVARNLNRLLFGDGIYIQNASVQLIGSDGNTLTISTTLFDFYSFSDVPSAQTY